MLLQSHSLKNSKFTRVLTNAATFLRLCFLICGPLFLSSIAQAEEPAVHMLVPGFTVRELPVKLSNINNLRFAPNGKLTALGYDGRVHLLSDTDGDGLEDKAEIFWDKPTITVPVGICWAPEGLYVSSHGKVSLLRDKDGDGKGDEEEIIATNWPPTDVHTGGTDATALARDKDGNVYFGLLTPDYSNPYRIGKDGKSRYSTNDIRGTIQKWSPKTKKLETVVTGIRVPYALEFNRAGDLFNTDQEGETWCPDGNPLDELNHIIPGRNYGFPPRQPQYLPDLISEPPIVGFGPQHQSACGFVFNEPEAKSEMSPGRGLFGPGWWEGDVFVAGESRGKIWRVRLVKTPHGYLGKEFTFARLGMLTTDVIISPKGDLYVSCHSGAPDWGTGPKGEGKLFKISYATAAPQPIAAWVAEPMEVRVAFDKALDESVVSHLDKIEIESGEFVRAADRYEKLKPSYQVVRHQESFPRGKLRVTAAKLSSDKHTLILTTSPHAQGIPHALTIPGIKADQAAGAGSIIDLEYDLNGVEAAWKASGEAEVWSGWLPHIDSIVNKEFTAGSAEHERLFHSISKPGRLELRSQLKLPAGTNIVYMEANTPFRLKINSTSTDGTKTKDTRSFAAQLKAVSEEESQSLLVQVETGIEDLSVHATYSTSFDSTRRPLPLAFFQLPWVAPHSPLPQMNPVNTVLTGGDFQRGKALFFSEKLKCATCHRIRGEGKTIGPDLSNLVHRDATSVLRDIKEPSVVINPDHVAFDVYRRDGESISGFVRAQGENSVSVIGVDGKETVIPRSDIKELRASSVSLMPSGLLDSLKDGGVRDLLTFLLHEPPKRKREEIEAIVKKGTASNRQSAIGDPQLRIVWVASKQDHGPGEHDYPVAQKMWIDLLNRDAGIAATNAWEWPSSEQFAKANVLVFYFWNNDWSVERLRQLDEFLARGGGLVVIHSGTIASKEPEAWAERIGLASRSGGFTKYLHAPFHLKLIAPVENPLVRSLPREIYFIDEPYWLLVGDTNKISVLATVEQEGKDWPQVWTFEKGKGRVFTSVIGHYTWTHEDPMYRILILRGLAWAAREEPWRFEPLAIQENFSGIKQ